MAGRVLFRKLSSRVSRSTSLFGAHASAPGPITCCSSEGGIRALGNLFNRDSVHPSTVAARHFNTLPCIPATSKTGSTTSGMPSVITRHMKLAFVDSVRPKRAFSSSTSTNDNISCKPKVPTYTAEQEAKWAVVKTDYEADLAAWRAKIEAETATFCRYITIIGSSWCVILLYWVITMDSEFSQGGTSSSKGQRGSPCCSCCCKCQPSDSKSDC